MQWLLLAAAMQAELQQTACVHCGKGARNKAASTQAQSEAICKLH